MYKLYWSPGSASMAPHMVLAEIGAPAEFKALDMDKMEHKGPDYLKINPLGIVPALTVDGKHIVTEAAAISIYLADRHPQAKLAPAVDDPARGTYLQWITYMSNTLQPCYLRYYYPDRATDKASEAPNVAAKAKAQLDDIYRHIDNHLAKNGPFFLGQRFSAADLYLAGLANWQEPVPGLYDRFPAVKRCVGEAYKRPAVAKVFADNGMAFPR